MSLIESIPEHCMAIPLIELQKLHAHRHHWIIELNGPAMLVAAVELISVFVSVIYNIAPSRQYLA